MILDYLKATSHHTDITRNDLEIRSIGSVVIVKIDNYCPCCVENVDIELIDLIAWVYNEKK